MTRRLLTPLGLTLTFLLLVVSVLIGGGFYIRSLLADSISNGERVRAARILVSDALQAQIDEETGVRGYASARDPVLLEPYYQGRAMLSPTLSRMRVLSTTLQLAGAQRSIDDAAATNHQWLRQIATPMLYGGRRHAHVLQLHGKILIDRFRADMRDVDGALAAREVQGDEHAQRAIIWVDSFAIAAVLTIVLAAAIFTVEQYRLGLRLEKERERAEVQRRESAEMRAAYQTEKRIADTLQEAFAQRVLPQLPALRLSATYEPASEEAKIGGDWYDALQLPHDRVLVVIGDVAGHGIEAAVAMNLARQLLTSCALVDPNPGSVLQRVNAQLNGDAAPMITAIVALVEAGKQEFAYAIAGHPAPVLLEPGSHARFLESGSLPLGVDPDTRYETRRMKTVPGATLVLYTDGVIEHSRDLFTGERLLLHAVETAARDPAQCAESIRNGIFDHHKVADDIAILAIHFVNAAAGMEVDETLPRSAERKGDLGHQVDVRAASV
ncbi:MAG: SpoIIE family protein phosphatase [Candidatus Eremiobacteraeota bacterium]|nr:SpoIIE family protein phosphatase [Candidatus Eremiobacteraeota bacterium]